MILLSENKDFKYYADPHPKDMDDKECLETTMNSGIIKYYYTQGASEPCKILGVIGSREEEGYFGETPVPYLKKLCIEKGIQIENPIPKPSIEDYWDEGFNFEFNRTYFNEVIIKDWQESESKTVKVVIIKVKQL